MMFRFNDNVKEAAFLAGLELEGVEIRNAGSGKWIAYGLSEEHRRYIEVNAAQFWAA
ncbi:MAG: hypothetical protein IKU36_01955 [Bacteroidales bacterium]|nr:hypothetical protein [Bacteroidales bacterium]